ncbi:MAG: hypothetical protein WC878_05470 [Candidatus Paceibacterota bacterium]
MIRPKQIKKDTGGITSDYVVVLGNFAVEEKKKIPAQGLIVTLNDRKSPPKISAPHLPRFVPRANPVASPFASVSKAASFLLLVFVSCNPLVPVYAEELPPSFPEILAAETENESAPQENAATPIEETPPAETVVVPEESVIAPEEIAPPDSSENITTATEEIPAEENPAAVPEKETSEPEIVPIAEEASTSTSAEPIVSDETSPEEQADIPPKEETVAPSEENAAGATEEMISNEEEPETTATDEEDEAVPEENAEEISEEIPAPAAPAIPPETPTPVAQPKVFFKDNECTPMDDGGFYCVSSKLSSTTETSAVRTPRVYSEAGINDDKEIFYEDAYEKTQITSNTYDDDAPSYDERTSLVLWQALLGGHYQIMLYDRISTTTGIRQITNTPYNSTNPRINGKSAVWQGWVNNNWEVFYTPDVTAGALEIRQITANAQNDMFPNLSEKFITWQSFFDDVWHVFVYDMETGATSQITKTIDGKYENPRFALLFEKRGLNGEVETIGYDVASGQEIPISHAGDSNSSSLPPIPEADNDKALPLQSATSTTTVKNAEKDGEGGEA